MRLQDNLEVELKLSVIGDDPDALLDDVAALREIAALRLEPAGDHALRDIYWDLPDGGLRNAHLSLRLRQIDDRQVFTAKGGTSNNDGLFRVPGAAIQGTKVFERDDFYPMDAAIFWQNQRNRGGTPFALVSFL